MIYIKNTSNNPAHNLALEEYLVKHEGRFAHEDIALLWQNAPTVVIGRNQNAHREINRTYLDEHNISVVRRLSGGGAVYHDEGNINFTVIKRDAHRLKNNFSFFTEPLVEALAEFGVEATFSGRNDVLVEGAKFSGNAQYSYGDTLLHHGTILFDSDLSVLGSVLTPKPRMEDYTTRGVRSHQSRVTNLREHLDIEKDAFMDALAQKLSQQDADTFAPVELTSEENAHVQNLAESKYATVAWTWGSSPQYNRVAQARFNAGNVMACVAETDGVVERFDLYGDFFEGAPVEELTQQFTGIKLEEMLEVARTIDPAHYIHAFTADDFSALLTELCETP